MKSNENGDRMRFSAKWRWRNCCLWETSTAILASGSKKTEPTRSINGHAYVLRECEMHRIGGCTGKENNCNMFQRQRQPNQMTMYNRSSFAFIFRAHILMWWHFVELVETERRVVICSSHLHLVWVLRYSSTKRNRCMSIRTIQTATSTKTNLCNLRLCIKFLLQVFCVQMWHLFIVGRSLPLFTESFSKK